MARLKFRDINLTQGKWGPPGVSIYRADIQPWDGLRETFLQFVSSGPLWLPPTRPTELVPINSGFGPGPFYRKWAETYGLADRGFFQHGKRPFFDFSDHGWGTMDLYLPQQYDR